MNETILGKISNIHFGVREGRLGLWLTLSGSSSCQTSIVCWDPTSIEVSKHTKWTEADRDVEMVKIMRKISSLLAEAEVDDVYKLNNIPVEFTFTNSMLSDWRILTEVL